MPYFLEKQFGAICDNRNNPGKHEQLDKLLSNPQKSLSKIDEKITELVKACQDQNPNKIINKSASVLFYELVALAHYRVDIETVCHRLQKKRGFDLETISVEEIHNRIDYFHNNLGKHEHLDKVFRKGNDRIREKLCEEVSEFVIACKDRKKVDIADEASDLLYYLLIALVYNQISLSDVCHRLNQKRNLV